MRKIIQFAPTLVGCVTAMLIATISAASAATLNLPYGDSQASFSIQNTYPDMLSVGPVVAIDASSCPGSHCNSAFWNVSLTVNFFDVSNNLLASDSSVVSESCVSGSCSVPRLAYFSIPTGSIGFEILNDVMVGGGWTYNAGTEFISASSQIAQTPLPGTILFFITGLLLLGMFARQQAIALPDQVNPRSNYFAKRPA